MFWGLPVALLAVTSAQDRPTFRAEVSQVHVDAEVLGKNGRIITGLSQSDFRVFDEGQEQTVVGFGADEEPLDIILLFDISGSMRSKVEKVTTTARQALSELRRGDRVAVMTFNTDTYLISSFTDDLQSVEANVGGVLNRRFGGGTYILQAVDHAAKYFLEDPRTHRRRAVLIITDNLGDRSRHKEMSAIYDLWEADASLSGLIIPDSAYPVRRAIVAVVAPYALLKVGGMDRIAEKTGGDTIRSNDSASAFPEMMRRIRSRYSLYYAAPGGTPGSFRSIRTELATDTQQRFPEARVYARRGYRLKRP